MKSMPSAGFEPVITAIKEPADLALGHTAVEIGDVTPQSSKFPCRIHPISLMLLLQGGWFHWAAHTNVTHAQTHTEWENTELV